MARTLIASDNFNRAALGADWTQLNPFDASLSINTSIRLTGSGAVGAANAAGRWDGAGTFTNDQYALAKLVNPQFLTLDYWSGVLVRASADTDAARDFYGAIIENGSESPYVTRVFKVVNGTYTSLANTTVAWVVGDTIELEVEGTSLRVYRNGSQISALNATDSALTTGKPGAMSSDSIYLDDWEGGNITASTTVTPGVGATSISGQVPSLLGDFTRTAAPGVGAVSFSYQTLSLARELLVSPAAPSTATLSIGGQIPAVFGQFPSPGVAALSINGLVPVVSTLGGPTTRPGLGAITLSGLAPALATSRTVTTDILTSPGDSTENPPTVLTEWTPKPGVGSTILEGRQPTIVRDTGATIFPSVGLLTLEGRQPSIPFAVGQDGVALPLRSLFEVQGRGPALERVLLAGIGVGTTTLIGLQPTIRGRLRWRDSPRASTTWRDVQPS